MGLNDYIQVGSKIKLLRKEKGITQKKMAELLEIPYTTYSNYENNNREPNADTLEKISIVLGVPVYELLNMDRQTAIDVACSGGEFSNKIAIDIVQERQVQELLRHFRNLNNDGRLKAIERIEELTYIDKYLKKNSVNIGSKMLLRKVQKKDNDK